MKSCGKFLARLWFFALIGLFMGLLPARPCLADAPRVQNYVMNHLGQVDRETLVREFKALKSMNVDAITVDLWWGLVEPEMGHYQWDYYKTVFSVAKEVGLGVVPIFSFHQAGGNAGDNTYIPLPSWVWTLAPDMKFIDSNGFQTTETVAYGVPEVDQRYSMVMQSFADNFKDYASIIKGFYVVSGPAGELRYPSFQGAAGWKYPQSGTFQAYSERYKKYFRQYALAKFKTIQNLNDAWHSQYKSFDEIQPPMDDLNHFFTETSKTPYGKDFLTFYEQLLVDHADTLLSMAESKLKTKDGPFSQIPLLVKIAGLHWLAGDPNWPHAAEEAAGYYDYNMLVDVIAKHHAGLAFTSLEMKDHDFIEADGRRIYDYSRPQEIIQKLADLAKEKGVPLIGENALVLGYNEDAYKAVRNALIKYNFAAFTLLRIENLVNGDGSTTWQAPLYEKYLTSVPVSGTTAGRAVSCALDMNF